MIIEFNGKSPQIAADVFVAPTAVIIGDVIIGSGSSVWFGAIIRGDTGRIRIGSGVSVQDNVVIHVNGRNDTIIDNDITIGHAAVLEGCHIYDGALIGMNATILDGAVIERGAVIAAGSVVRENFVVPAATLLAGVPGKVRGAISPGVQARLAAAPEEYRGFAANYLAAGIDKL